MKFSQDEIARYARHLILPEVGLAGQTKLRQSSVLCIGVGGLGSSACLYLAAAGIGRLGVVDGDPVELSNLQRQILHGTRDVGRPKTESARRTLLHLNPHVQLETFPAHLTSANAVDIISGYDAVLDCTDNFPARYLINDACVLLRKPNAYGAVYRMEGQASLFAPHLDGPCYRCLFPTPPPPGTIPSCVEAGVLGIVPGIIGCIQAMEILKVLLQLGDPLLRRLLLFDASSMRFRELKIRRDPECPICGQHPQIQTLTDCPRACSHSTTPTAEGNHPDEVSVVEMKKALDDSSLGIQVLDIREAGERAVAAVEGTAFLPLSQLLKDPSSLDPDKTYYLYCHSGGRSLGAVDFLKKHGFMRVKSVRGGIQAWSVEIDPRVPVY
ncbi:MAG TPA: molybdopterin-synthase adenylyltransferase MoeB [Candidatus Paceibacterota bacterium]|nr:molybdopterin-synthase adenylyltransferase MoeB [Verrucomicrobiota bacterium]HRY47730.1 molybdopterin-synthase adenylyltransferase MoeB [Candidatus Paceibacterota bacterium]HSA03286.1 molybdopterin-synthase adenylyltransferase MoeB [Candidatus Paceibacterota bacterium]